MHAAVDRGVTFFDTAECYGPFTNEVLVGLITIVIPSYAALSLVGECSWSWQDSISGKDHYEGDEPIMNILILGHTVRLSTSQYHKVK